MKSRLLAHTMVAYAMVMVIMSAGPAAASLNTTSGPEPCEVFPLSFDLDGDKAPESILYEGEWPDVSLRRIASTDAVAGHAGLSAEALYRVVAGEQRYRLDMLGLRKHVERPDPQSPVAAHREAFEVARQVRGSQDTKTEDSVCKGPKSK